MRRGEILILRWSQIRNGLIYLEKTKTNEARQIPIDDDLAKVFRQIRKEQQLSPEYAFTNRNGEHKLKGPEPVRKRTSPTPVTEAVSNVKTAFKSALKRAGTEDFKFHDLRHTFASEMIMRRANLKDEQEILGHKTITLRYARLSQEHKKKAASLLNGLTAPEKAYCHKSVRNLKSSISAIGQVAEITGRGERI